MPVMIHEASNVQPLLNRLRERTIFNLHSMVLIRGMHPIYTGRELSVTVTEQVTDSLMQWIWYL